MAYAAVVSLVQTLNQILQNSDHELPLQYYRKPQIHFLHDKLCSLQSTLDKIFPAPKSFKKRVIDLEIQIRDAMYIAQDKLESFISSQIIQPLSQETVLLQSQDFLQQIVADIEPITKTAEEVEHSIRHSQDKNETGDSFSENADLSTRSISDSPLKKIVGREKDLDLVTKELMSSSNNILVVPITGMTGIGKTALARNIYEDHRIAQQFSSRAWVTVSQEYRFRDVLSKLLSSISGTYNHGDEMRQKSEAQMAIDLHQSLYQRKYLIVVDDVSEKSIWDKVRRCFPDDKNGSRILVTTRSSEVSDYAASSGFRHEMKPLDQEDSWKLLCQNVFGDGLCPVHLESIGREIARSCKGLPLSLTVVGGLLSKEEMTRNYWRTVAEDTNAAAAESENESYLEILSLSYNSLPLRLKGCFLYMGAFPEDSEIHVSKLIQLWIAEGFLTQQSPPYQSLEQVAQHCLNDLIDRNLISARKISSNGQIKSCMMLHSLRDLAVKESQKENFFHSVYKNSAESSQGKESQRRLSVHKNILMCMEDIHNSTKSIKSARTLLYVGQHHHHPLPYCLTFDLLRILDAVTVYYIDFPDEIVKLIHLRYLSLTYNGKLPKSVSKLRFLQVLIVRRNPKIIFTDISFLPAEIWDMPQLRHILFTESCLPDLSALETLPQHPLLANLQTLSNGNASCLTKAVLQNIPNLKKLGAWVEGPDTLELFVDDLKQLEAFKFTVLNPIPGSRIDFRPKLAFPKTLRKLSLSGCGIPWEDITVIGKLPYLEVLKLREFAFQGAEWHPNKREFRRLKFLLLEALDLEYWDARSYHFFPCLERLIIRRCYELLEMPKDIGKIGGLQLIELVNCSRKAVEWAEYIKEEQQDAGNKSLQIRIYSSWE